YPVGGDVFYGSADPCKGSEQITDVNNIADHRALLYNAWPPGKSRHPDTTFKEGTGLYRAVKFHPNHVTTSLDHLECFGRRDSSDGTTCALFISGVNDLHCAA
ncbi:hypothetical protein ACFL0S_10430, partial [Thermodesulfobacteriota bacterium]